MANGEGGGAGKTVLIIFLVLLGLAVVCCGAGYFLVRGAVEDFQAEWVGVEGSGALVTETREVAEFERVEIRGAGGAGVDIAVGETTSVTVELDENVIALLTTEVVDGALVIEATEAFTASDGARVTLVTPRLTALVIAGYGDASVTGVNTPSFSLEIEGAGDVNAQGSADDVTVSVKGAGDVDFEDLAARRARVTIDGAGDVTVHATESVHATIRGAGNVRYAGEPETVERDVSGAGSVEPLAR